MGEPDTTFNVASETGDVDCVIDVWGDVDLRSLAGLRGLLRDAIAPRPVMPIIDLTDADIVEVSGLAVLAGARHRARDIRTSVLLQAPNATIVDLIAASGLDQALPVVPGLRFSAEKHRPRRPFPMR